MFSTWAKFSSVTPVVIHPHLSAFLKYVLHLLNSETTRELEHDGAMCGKSEVSETCSHSNNFWSYTNTIYESILLQVLWCLVVCTPMWHVWACTAYKQAVNELVTGARLMMRNCTLKLCILNHRLCWLNSVTQNVSSSPHLLSLTCYASACHVLKVKESILYWNNLWAWFSYT